MGKQRGDRRQLGWVGLAAVVAVGFLVTTTAVRAQAGAPAGPAPDDKTAWHGSVAFGLTLTHGNSSTLQMNGTLALQKLLPRDEFRFGAEGNYGLNDWTRDNETVSAENVHGFGDYKHLFTERLYGDLRADAFHDSPADIKYRVNLGPAVGYYFIKSEQTRFNAEVGPGFQVLKQDDEESKFFTLRIGERYEHAFNKIAKVWEEINYFPRVDDFDEYLVLGEAGVETSLTTRLALRVVGQDKYNSRPAPGSKNNDITLITSVVWKF